MEQKTAANAAVLDAVYGTQSFGTQGWLHHVQQVLRGFFGICFPDVI